jgi:Ala-tRNA(Pro) deacylase
MRVIELLDRERIPYTIDEHSPAGTAIALAVAEHVSGHQVIKPVVAEADGVMVMCALPADRRIDMGALRNALGARHVRLVTEDELPDLCLDCELGAEAPVGRLYGMDTLMDESLLDSDMMVFQAGTHHTAVRLGREEFQKLTNARVVNISRPD